MIRCYKKEDYKMILSWWKHYNEFPPFEDMLPEESTFILEYENKPAVCLTIYLTNSKAIVYFENFIKNPELDKEISKKLSYDLIQYGFEHAKKLGYRFAICLADKEGLKKRYSEYGFTKTLDNVITMAKEL